MQATIIIFMTSIKVQDWKWWCSDDVIYSVIRLECYSIFIDMNLKFSLFLELLQNCSLFMFSEIKPLNGFEFFEHIRFCFYCSQDWFWSWIKSVPSKHPFLNAKHFDTILKDCQRISRIPSNSTNRIKSSLVWRV